MKILVTGGCGFIGSWFIRNHLLNYPNDNIINLDKLTYAGHLSSTDDFSSNSRYKFIQGDICDPLLLDKIVPNIDLIVHFAAESHVDRSVIDPLVFIKTNILGTAVLLTAALKYNIKRFHLISTDEVFGQLQLEDPPFTETTPYNPQTPYASSKTAADLLVKSYFKTYNLPITITNCSNNFGPFQDIEKLIPRFITNLLQNKKVPLMGKGANVRDWISVEDHVSAIETVIKKGVIGESYCVGGEERSNLEVTRQILKILGKDESMIEFVDDRLGHDFRYAIDSTKLHKLGWKAKYGFESYLKVTVYWYTKNTSWWEKDIKNRPVVDRVAQKSYKGNR